jgi:hypothetical protein
MPQITVAELSNLELANTEIIGCGTKPTGVKK